ncbi:type VII secretion protein EssA [Virgibacillus sp. C22-A2]|uniref:Type VII secretion protein EssA n=1 Tax=Virgibacillus tibetensis TaxID=3042313 RepID=A0ABU6KLA8_9BACI|nr:type VII secretion protein EssA [Virgibacillus sp. C22-A2]
MKSRLKVNVFLLVTFILLMFDVNQTSAETNMNDMEPKSGSLQLKIDRIIKGESERTQMNQTELEKVFPTLFTEETQVWFTEVKKEQEESLEELERSLFTKEIDSNTTALDIKEALFASDYTSSASSFTNQVSQEDSGSGFGEKVLVTLTALALLLCGGLYFMMQKLFD